MPDAVLGMGDLAVDKANKNTCPYRADSVQQELVSKTDAQRGNRAWPGEAAGEPLPGGAVQPVSEAWRALSGCLVAEQLRRRHGPPGP